MNIKPASNIAGPKGRYIKSESFFNPFKILMHKTIPEIKSNISE